MRKRNKISVFVLTFMLAVSMLPTFANAEKMQNNVYFVENKNSGQMLSIETFDTWNGVRLVQYPDNYTKNTWNRRWRVTYMGTDGGGDYYKFVNYYSGKALDVPGCTHDPGVQMRQWRDNGTNAQLWYARRNSDGSVSLINRGSGLFLDVYGGSQKSLAPVIQWYGNGGLNQHWWIWRTMGDPSY